MEMTVVYETVYGTTREVAEAIADGARGAGATVTVLAVGDAADIGSPDMLVVGGPTHVRGMSTPWSRGKASPPAEHGTEAEADEAEVSQGVREWLAQLPEGKGPAAAFDTRLGNPLAGGAARPIARALRRHGHDVVSSEGFVVDAGEGPLRAGEVDRARAWGAELAGHAA